MVQAFTISTGHSQDIHPNPKPNPSPNPNPNPKIPEIIRRESHQDPSASSQDIRNQKSGKTQTPDMAQEMLNIASIDEIAREGGNTEFEVKILALCTILTSRTM